MAERGCERCGSAQPGPRSGPYALFDYCAACSRNLCQGCMSTGCCGQVPARSGIQADDPLNGGDDPEDASPLATDR